MFRIKICGVTRPEDATHAVGCGADAIGINFYPKSPRFLDPASAAAVSRACGDALVVGVFVNAPVAEILQTLKTANLGAIQLHGDETAEFALQLPAETPIIRAVRMRPGVGLGPVAKDLARLREAGRAYAAVLVDAAGSVGEYGGTGQTADWEAVSEQRSNIAGVPLILAGGLTPSNVGEAVQQTLPHGVDTASGVESAPGLKDPEAVRAFVKAAAEALESR